MATCDLTSVPDEYVDQDSMFGGTAPLPIGVGWAVVLGFGLLFSLITTVLVWLDMKYNKTIITSEHFNTAGRTVKTGLTASVIVSQWTWAATLLQSSNVAWQYGVSGPFWYASGATIQVLLFGIIAIEVKRKAPTAHTFLEIVDARWGRTAHKVFLVFALLTNTIVTSMLLLGGAATVNALTGMDLDAASFLIPIGVIAYTMAGGLKATFLASYIHTDIIFIALLLFVFYIYMGPDKYIGSASRMYDLLENVANIPKDECKYGPDCEFTLTACGGVSGNRDGSYLTMLSTEGLVFGIINVVGNFGTVFVDQSYWQSAIAARPQSSHKGYLIGGMAWFTIPFALATSLGLAAVAMQLPLTSSEAGAGLVPPATALYVLGDGGATLILIMLFMAITSTGSAELIAVSSLLSYDVYRTYFNPQATGADILRVSRYIILGFGLTMGVLSILLNAIGLGLGWVYLFMGVVIGSAVVPVSVLLTWRKATAPAVMTGAVVGQILGLISWIVTASIESGEVSVDTLGKNYPMLVGNLFAILSSGFIVIVMSMMNPDDYNWESTKAIPMIVEGDSDTSWQESGDYDDSKLMKAKGWIMNYGLAFTIVIVILWPILSLPAGVFSKSYFSFWVGLSVVWGVVATAVLVFLPLFESFTDLMGVLYGIFEIGDYVPTEKKIEMLEKRLAAIEGGGVFAPTKDVEAVKTVEVGGSSAAVATAS